MTRPDFFSGLYEVLEQQCSTAQIEKFLRDHKELSVKHENEIRIGHPNKSKLVEHVRHVVTSGLITREALEKAIQSCEESGRQHIFLYRPTRSIAALVKNGAEVANQLFGEAWGPDYFPIFERTKNKNRWVDFRRVFNGKRQDWLLKSYGHEKIDIHKGSSEKRISDTEYQLIQRYETKDYCTVCVARYNSPNILEIRIDSVGSSHGKKVMERRLAAFWKLLGPAFNVTDFVPLSLEDHVTNLMARRKINGARYGIGRCTIRSSDRGRICFYPDLKDEEKDDFDGDKGREGALNALLNNQAKGENLVVFWKLHEKFPQIFKSKDDTIRTIITGDHFNELVVTSRITAPILDHITSELRRFEK